MVESGKVYHEVTLPCVAEAARSARTQDAAAQVLALGVSREHRQAALVPASDVLEPQHPVGVRSRPTSNPDAGTVLLQQPKIPVDSRRTTCIGAKRIRRQWPPVVMTRVRNPSGTCRRPIIDDSFWGGTVSRSRLVGVVAAMALTPDTLAISGARACMTSQLQQVPGVQDLSGSVPVVFIIDRGPQAWHPADTAEGHADDCQRLAAEIAA